MNIDLGIVHVQVLCDVTRLIAQTVFSLIDYIVIWINKKRAVTSKGTDII